jgi:NAD(P)-dependent dehydrogenase (short-subunit alcohol dehydrogenase family)
MGEAADKATVERMRTQAEEAFGGVDIYISNAARRLYKDFLLDFQLESKVGELPRTSSRGILTRPGVSGGSRSWEDLSFGTCQQVSRRAS